MKIKLLHLQDFLATDTAALKTDELHIWILPAEEDKLHKKVHEQVKEILARTLQIPVQTLRFQTGAHGKPYICADSGHTLQFNLSHSGAYMALAISAGSPVGIDIENTGRKVNFVKMAERFFHPEEVLYLNHLQNDKKKEAFFRLWTIKEAFLKGLGTGLTVNPASFRTTCSDAAVFKVIPSDPLLAETYADWELVRIPAPDGYLCTVACRATAPDRS